MEPNMYLRNEAGWRRLVTGLMLRGQVGVGSRRGLRGHGRYGDAPAAIPVDGDTTGRGHGGSYDEMAN